MGVWGGVCRMQVGVWGMQDAGGGLVGGGGVGMQDVGGGLGRGMQDAGGGQGGGYARCRRGGWVGGGKGIDGLRGTRGCVVSVFSSLIGMSDEVNKGGRLYSSLVEGMLFVVRDLFFILFYFL